MKLGDGNTWEIPVVRRFSDSVGFTDNLPRIIDQDENGQWIYGGIVGRHAPLWEAVGRFVDNLCGVISHGKEIENGTYQTEYTISDELDTISMLLTANYVLGPTEIAALGLLVDDGTIIEILKIASDWQKFVDWAESKKNESAPDTPSTGAGRPD